MLFSICSILDLMAQSLQNVLGYSFINYTLDKSKSKIVYISELGVDLSTENRLLFKNVLIKFFIACLQRFRVEKH